MGRSVDGTALTATIIGPEDAARTVLVVGAIHGDEPAGPKIIRLLAKREPPPDTRMVLVSTVNPDGLEAKTRQNARHVDLNRNFPFRWLKTAKDRYYGGPKAASEPETQWVMQLVKQVKPQLSIWFHQPYGFVVRQPDGNLVVQKRYAKLVRLPFKELPSYHGTAVTWENSRDPRSNAFVVELPAGLRPAAELQRHAAAVLTVAGMAP